MKLKSNESDKQCLEDIVIEDLLLAELLGWFKLKFFQWVNSPVCPICKCEGLFKKVETSSNAHISRIEIHK